MSDIRIEKDMKLIKVLAAKAKNERLDSNVSAEADNIVSEILAGDLNKNNAMQIAQTVAYTVNEMQPAELDFLSAVADQKTINYGDKAAFNMMDIPMHATIQAKGATAPRSKVQYKQVLVDTKEIAVRPAIGIVDVKAGRVNMADLIREANRQMTLGKLAVFQTELKTALAGYSDPTYATGTGVVKTTLDAQLNYFRKFGQVTILGDFAAVSQLAPLTGMAMNANANAFSGNLIDEHNENGFIGRYIGTNVVAMTNAYQHNTADLILDDDILYIVPTAASADARNFKVVTEGTVNSMESTSIDDRTYEILLYQWFGCKWVPSYGIPSIGAYKMN